jgi:streptomycin 6-kinase
VGAAILPSVVTFPVPAELVTARIRYLGDEGRAWIDALPALAATYLDRWGLTIDGAPASGVTALVLPVVRCDGSRAALKLQQADPMHPGEALALRTWDGDGAVRLLDEDHTTWTLLLERLDGGRDLRTLPVDEAVRVIAELLTRLTAVPAPPGVPPLREVAAAMLAEAPSAAASLPDSADAACVRRCAAALAEVADEAGDRLLHWDLHYENVRAAGREPWLAIDPKPLAGDPAFELLPALHNRWEEAAATGDPAKAVRRRFDLMVEVMGLDRDRAVAWTLGRLLQDAIWDVEDGATALPVPRVLIAEAITRRPAGGAG